MRAFLPSVRGDLSGVQRVPVLVDASLSGEWIPPSLVYLARDVEALIKAARLAVDWLESTGADGSPLPQLKEALGKTLSRENK